MILQQPDRYIPQNIEDIADVVLSLRGEGFEKIVAIEVVNIRSYTLRVKLKNIEQIAEFSLDDVKQANISIQNPVFLLEELKDRYSELHLLDDFDFQRVCQAMCVSLFLDCQASNQTFVFQARSMLE